MSNIYSSSNWTVENIYQMANIINFEPDYQRQRVWKLSNNQLLIDTILRGFPIPPIFVNQTITDGILQYDMMDGRQRIEATIDFLDNNFKTGSMSADAMEDELDENLDGLYFKELPLRAQNQIKSYSFHILNFSDTDNATDVFSRINNGVPLNRSELRHAMVNSALRNIICHAVSSHDFFKQLPVKNTRYAHEDIAAQIFIVCEKNGFATLNNNELDAAYDRYGHITPSKATLAVFNDVLNILAFIVANYKYSMRWNKSVILVFMLIYVTLKDAYKLDSDALIKIANAYIDIKNTAHMQSQLPIEKRTPEFQHINTNQSMTVESRQRTYVMVLLNIMFKTFKLSPKPQRDPRRAFNSYERELALYRAGYKCECCGDKVLMSTFEAHHIVPHSKGGLTTLDNLQVLCKRCHLETHHPQSKLGV